MGQVRSVLNKVLMMAVFVIPVNSGQNWQVLKYRKIKPNGVVFDKQGLGLEIKGSASPVIFPLPGVKKVKRVRVTGQVYGSLKLEDGAQQGKKGFDDYQVRIGLVLKGTQRLNFFQRKLAADWVVKLFELAPKEMGVDHILFLNATHVKAHLGKKREHPLSDLIKEEVVWLIPEDGKFEWSHEFEQSREVLALWLSSDGDDTQSNYKVQFQKIELSEEDSGVTPELGTKDSD